MRKLFFALALILLIVIPVGAETNPSNITLSKDFTATDKTKKVTYDLTIPNWVQGTATLAYVLAHSTEGSCSEVIVGIGDGYFFGSEPTVEVHRETFTTADVKFSYSEKIVDILNSFVNSFGYDDLWDENTIYYNDIIGKYLCLRFGLVLDGFGDDPDTASTDYGSWEKRDNFQVRILSNPVDKAIEEVEDNFKHPFTGTNLWWTIGVVVIVVGIAVFIYMRRKN